MKLPLLRASDPDLVRALQAIQVAFDQVPESTERVSAYITKNYTVASDVDFVFADPSGGAITVTLPQTGTFSVTVRNVSNSSNSCTVQMASAAKINGTQAVVTVPGGTSIAFRYNSQTRGWWTA